MVTLVVCVVVAYGIGGDPARLIKIKTENQTERYLAPSLDNKKHFGYINLIL